MTGRTLGHYRIDAKLGEGGMGEVYKALDTRLDRTVAIKVLPAHLAQNPELRQRFEREARVISSLNHPNICTLHDVGRVDEIDFLVMEYLEGETLAARLARGPLELAQVLRVAVQIAEALAQAHRQGVYHRDLKPGNVMLTKAGAKLLDFGLAKLVGPASRPADAPTLADQLTQAGSILGTVQYMAPEQLEGREAGAPSDIFAFGAVLFEMVTGRKAFEGRSQASVITAIMSTLPPPLATLAPAAPAGLQHVVEKCLAKDPEERWQNAQDLAGELKWMAGSGAASQVIAAPPARAPRSRRETIAWVAAAALLVAVLALGAVHFREVPEKPRAMRFHVALPENMVFRAFDFPVVSPDGERIVFSIGTASGGPGGLWVRSLNSLGAQSLASGFGSYPFWSPDSRSVGFFSQGKLLRVDLSGAPPLNLCDSGFPGGGTWGRDGTILLGSSGAIRSVPASGGEPKPVTTVDTARGESGHYWPQFLPDGRRFLYFINGNPEVRGIYAGSLGSQDKTKLVAAEVNGLYARGYLLFLRGSVLMAQPLDAAQLRLRGEPSPVADPVSRQTGVFANHASFSTSESGILAYLEGTGIAHSELVWFDRDGRKAGTAGEAADYSNPALSPDGSRVAVGVRDPRTSTRDIWLLDLKRGSSSRLTFDAAEDLNPAWSPDGRRIAFSSNRKGSRDIYWKASDGTGEEELLLASSQDKSVEEWSPDGKWLTFNEGSRALAALRLEPERKASPLLKGQFTQIEGRLSPNGRWIAYRSQESGRPEIYVQSFPPGSGKWQVSAGGGTEPAWRRDGKELFFMGDRKLLAAETKTEGSSFEAGIPKPLFEPPRLGPQNRNRYVVTPDGKRFLFVVPLDSTSSRPFVVLVNWDAGRKEAISR